MKFVSLLAPVFIAVIGNAFASPTVTSLCLPDEKVVFSCSTGKKKVVSLCSSPLLTSNSGYMQYRFGVPGKPPELVYPRAREHPKRHFQSGTLMFAGGGGTYLKFNNGQYAYTVYTGIGRGWEKEGVVVDKSGNRMAHLECQGAWISEIGPELFELTEIPRDPNEFDIP